MSTISWNETHITIDHGSKKNPDPVHVPHAAIHKVTADNGVVRLHVRGIVHPRPSLGDNHDRYASIYFSNTKAEKIKADIENAIQYYGLGKETLEGWTPQPQSAKALAIAEKKGTYTSWVNKHAAANERKQREAAHLQKIDQERGFSAPAWYEKNLASFGDIKVNGNATITFNGNLYNIKGARAGVDMGMANNKKFGKGRLVMGAAAAPLVGVLAAPALIRKQKGIITLEVILADGTCLVTVGNSGHGGKSEAIKTVQEITRQAI